jgi:hypothetical protein
MSTLPNGVLTAFDIKNRQQLVLNVAIPFDAFTATGFLGQFPDAREDRLRGAERNEKRVLQYCAAVALEMICNSDPTPATAKTKTAK